MPVTLSIIVWPIIVFYAVWAITLLSVKKTVEKDTISEGSYWIFTVIGAMLVLVPAIVPEFVNLPVLGIPLIRSSLTLQSFGFLIEALGVCLAVWARITLGRNWSSSVTFKENHELITKGPYRLVRHPIYTGMTSMYLGVAIYLGMLAGFLGVLFISYSFWIKSRQEEKLMIRHFPKEYAAYKKTTKALIPFIY